jgi:hypothetical protein
LPCGYSLPWLDARRSIVPPRLLARADIPRASWPRSPSSRTLLLATTIAAASPPGPPDAAICATSDDLSSFRSTLAAVRGK